MHNRYYARTTRNAIRALRNTTDKEAATALLPKVSSMIDKLAKINVIHKNKAANLKSGISVYVNKLNTYQLRHQKQKRDRAVQRHTGTVGQLAEHPVAHVI